MNSGTMGGPPSMSVRFDPGDGVAIVGGGAVCLVFDDPRSDLVVRLREALSGPSGADAALDVMVRTHGLDLPPFGLVTVEGAQVRVLVRGGVGARVQTAGESIEIVGDRVRTWVERVVDDAVSILLSSDPTRLDPFDTPAFDATSGLLPAGRLEVVLGTAPPASDWNEPTGTTQLDPTVFGAPDEAGWPAEAMAEPVADPYARAEDAQPQAVDPYQADDGPSEWPSGPVVTVDDVDAWTPDVGAAPDPADLPVPLPLSPPDQPAPDPVLLTSSDSALLDSTLLDSTPLDGGQADGDQVDGDQADSSPPEDHVQGQLVVFDTSATLIGPFDLGDDEPERPDQPSGTMGDPTPPPFDPANVGSGAAPREHVVEAFDGDADRSGETNDDYDHLFGATQYRTVEQAAVRPDEDAGEGPDAHAGTDTSSLGDPMIAGVPGSADVGPTPGVGDHDGHTVSLAALRAHLGSSAPTAGTTPSVHAVHCPAGHLNPTHAGMCRACGAAILDQEHVSVPRPVLGNIVFADGRVVTVSRPLLIGRAPKVDGALSGEAPELVVVASPLKEVSSTHVELRLEGWQVLVVDRQSTNGTIVTAPGRDPQRLRPGEPVPIVAGTVVNLADEVMFTFEVAG